MDKTIPKYYREVSKKITPPGKFEKYSFFNKWGDRYRLKRLAKFSKGKVLDIGYAFGPNPFLKNVYGIDIFLPEIRPKNYQKLFVTDINHPYPYPFKNEYFDSIVAGEVVEHLPNMDAFMKEMHRIIKPGGILCLSTPNPESPVEIAVHALWWLRGYNLKSGIKGGHVHEFPVTNMITLMKWYGFQMTKIEGTYVQIPFTKIQIPMNIVPLTYSTIYVARKKQKEALEQ